MPVMDYYWNGRTDPAYNLALEEVMVEQADAPFAMLWPPSADTAASPADAIGAANTQARSKGHAA